MYWVVRLITGSRSGRSEMKVPAAAKIPRLLTGADKRAQAWLEVHRELIERLARLDAIATTGDVPKGSLQFVHDEATVALPLADVIDIAEERSRLQKEIAKADGEIAKLGRKLGNEQFLAKAPQEVVEEQRERSEEHTSELQSLMRISYAV